MKLNKKKLIKLIKEIVKKEIEKQKTDIIAEVVSYMDQEDFSSSSSNEDDDLPVDTDDPVLKNVLRKNKQKEKNPSGDDVAEQVYEESKDETRDPETIREKILQVQESAKSPNPDKAGQNVQEQQVGGPLNEPAGHGAMAGQQQAQPNIKPQHQPKPQGQQQQRQPQQHQPQRGGGQPNMRQPQPQQQPTPNPAAGAGGQGQQVADAEEGFPSEDQFQTGAEQKMDAQQAAAAKKRQVNQGASKSSNVPGYLQSAANKDYSELVDRFDE